jgi:hypothetical protein
MKNTKTIKASFQLLLLPLLTMLATLFAFTGKVPANKELPAAINIPTDTVKLKYFSRVEVGKTTGHMKKIALNDVFLFIINNNRYTAKQLLYKFNEATLRADEMIVSLPNDKTVIDVYGPEAAKGVIEFKNATLIPPMLNAKNKPLFLLDGVEQTDIETIKSFDPNEILGITVLRDPRNTVKYGAKAKYGLVEIMKNKNSIVEIREVKIESVPEEGIKEEIPPPAPGDQDKRVVEPPTPYDPQKLYENTEIYASFKGGEAGFRKYLEANLDRAVPKKNGAQPAVYTVYVQFIVELDGTINSIKALTNHGRGMEEEVLRLIKTTSGKWLPGVQHGREVRSYRKQPVTFIVE